MTIIYVQPDCPYCSAAIRELESRGEPFTVIDVHKDPQGRERLARLTADTMLVPVIVEADGSVRYSFGAG
jgi:glutaredoxin